MRYIYTLFLYIATPFIFLRLLWRSRRLAAYRHRLSERLGFYPFKLDKCIWLHAVSVGETLAAIPMIKALKLRYPDTDLLVTTMTPTGSSRVKALFGDAVKHVYLPYDLPDAVSRFLASMNPLIGVIIETELWPNLLAACHQKNIPVCLVNARLSAKSAKGYQCVASLSKEIMNHLTHIAAHGQADANRFYELGAAKERVSVTGNIKFDLEVPENIHQEVRALRELLGNRFIWIAASTHEGEEEIVLTAHQKVLANNPNALLILVPRHPDRFEKIAALCNKHFKTVTRSSEQPCDDQTAVYLGDTMGDLMLLYAVADVAFVGGSLIPSGGHNILEPAALAKPILTGPYNFNFADINELFATKSALIKVADATTLADAVINLMQNIDERNVMGQRAILIINTNRGALAKQLALIDNILVPQELA